MNRTWLLTLAVIFVGNASACWAADIPKISEGFLKKPTHIATRIWVKTQFVKCYNTIFDQKRVDFESY